MLISFSLDMYSVVGLVVQFLGFLRKGLDFELNSNRMLLKDFKQRTNRFAMCKGYSGGSVENKLEVGTCQFKVISNGQNTDFGDSFHPGPVSSFGPSYSYVRQGQ